MAQTNDTTFGVLLIATWVTSVLYTLEIIAVRKYFKKYSGQDPMIIRMMVKACLAVNTMNLLAQYSGVYLYSVTHWGDKPYLQHQNWPFPVYVATTGLSGVIVQFFLIRRYHHLARQRIVTWCLGGSSLAALGGAITLSVKVSVRNEYDSRNTVFIPTTVWFSLTAGTDLAVAAALVYQLQTMRSGFKSSEGLVRRISYMAISSGVVPSSLAIVVLVTYWAFMTTNVPSFFAFFMASTYHHTMLYNLNSRNSLVGNGPPSFASPSAPFRGEPGSLGFNLTGILRSLRVTGQGEHPEGSPQHAGTPRDGYQLPGVGANTGTTATSATMISQLSIDPHDDGFNDAIELAENGSRKDGRKTPPGLEADYERDRKLEGVV